MLRFKEPKEEKGEANLQIATTTPLAAFTQQTPQTSMQKFCAQEKTNKPLFPFGEYRKLNFALLKIGVK